MYITNFNLNRVLHTTYVENIDIPELSDICNVLDVLSDEEKRQLTAAKKLFKNEILKPVQKPLKSRVKNSNKGSELCLFVPLDEPIDGGDYVRPPAKPAYHVNSQCERLHSDWINVEIPERVRKIGKEAVRDYRKLFPKDLLVLRNENERQILANMIRAQMLSKYGIDLAESEIIAIKEKDNSGDIGFKVSELDIRQKLNELKKNLDNPIYKQVYNMRYLPPNKIRYLIENKEGSLRELAEMFARLKEDLKFSLIDKLKDMTAFNQENISVEVLEHLGFVPCSHCTQEQVIDRLFR